MFSICDTSELYAQHLKSEPADWYYRSANITYNYNSYGHRCKNIANIDLDNYILFSGCSHTYGEGLELEQTFPYLISEQLGMDYYNLGLGGTGIDVMEYNLLTWFRTIQKKPKFVVIQWTDHSRYAGKHENNQYLIEAGTWSCDAHIKKFICAAEESGLFNARKLITRNLLLAIIDVPVYEIHFNNHSAFAKDCIYIKRLDFARDMCHAGIVSNRHISEQLLAVIRNNDK
jgi:hypothetical protein